MIEITKIEYTNSSEIIGCYDPITDVIILNEKLKQNMRVHNRVLEHELLHAVAKKNLLKHLYIDLTDNFKHIFDREAIYFMSSFNAPTIFIIANKFVNAIIYILLFPFFILAQLYFLYLYIVDKLRVR